MVSMAFKLYFNGCKKPYHWTCHGLKGNLHVSKSGSLVLFKSCLGYSSSVYTPWCPHKIRRPEKKTQKQRLQGLFILNLQIILCCLWWSTSLRLVWDTVRLFQNLIHLRRIACRGRKFHISFIISWFIYHDYRSCFSFNSLLLKLVEITDDTNAEKALPWTAAFCSFPRNDSWRTQKYFNWLSTPEIRQISENLMLWFQLSYFQFILKSSINKTGFRMIRNRWVSGRPQSYYTRSCCIYCLSFYCLLVCSTRVGCRSKTKTS